MGLFGFGSGYGERERQLLEEYTEDAVRRGVPRSQARKEMKRLIGACIEVSEREGSIILPPNFGDILVGAAETTDAKVRELAEHMRTKIPMKKKEGATDEDLRWFWNLNDIERRMLVDQVDHSGLVLFASEMQKGKSPEEAGEMVRHVGQMYGDYEDTEYSKGDDNPLPYELMRRVSAYRKKRTEADEVAFMEDIYQSSTFNALIRREITAGNL